MDMSKHPNDLMNELKDKIKALKKTERIFLLHMKPYFDDGYNKAIGGILKILEE